LKPAQKQAVDALVDGTYADLTRGAYEALTGMSRSQAAYDLADLVEAGVLERVGSGRATRYRLSGHTSPAPRRWTAELIRQELDRFCAGRGEWPSASEFKAAGHWDLYVAASRYGGVKFWIGELGFPRAAPARPRRLRSVSFATVGAVVGAVAVAVGALLIWPSARPSLLRTPDPKIVVEEQAPRGATSARHERTRARRPTKSVTSSNRRARAQTIVVSRVATAAPPAEPPPPPAPAVRVAQSASPPPPAGPVPLQAPNRSAGTPSPLPAP
jgi:DNA-binding transcriptional ArsR family regulator